MAHDEVVELEGVPNPAISFVLLAMGWFVLSKSALRSVAPKEARNQGPVTVWKWVNTANSLVHSFVTGIGALVCVYFHPRVAENVVSTYSDFSHRLVCYSVGYFIFDFLDMLINHRKRSSYELMIHHVFVLSCFTLSIATRYYLAFTIISLVVEVNSIFLHWRQLLIITRTPKTTLYYRTVSLLNLITFVVFRIVTLGWMTRWLALNSDLVDPAPYTCGCISIAVLMLMSMILFVRLLKADFHSNVDKRAYNSSCANNNKAQ
ncbi:TLC domain-containing protein 2 [Orchesella cincta]|uniref:TLC domain-containing protein 2 n=1 Tax=Orchesella cincta TaxID=48709 RepID=A0A1D2MVX3_ORCCI|nr:TLC domain-containing protein 2 [Orchesella cincta]